MNSGLLYALGAFTIWGLFPLYLRELSSVPSFEVLLQRSVWSLVFVLGVLAALGRLSTLREVFSQPRRVALFALSAVLLSANWLIYLLAVQGGHVLDASLGYFMNPLVNVVLGVLVLKERLRPTQWLAVALAALGVAWLTLMAGRPPWYALSLAFSFGLYGLIRKTATLGALEGLALETLLLAPIVVPALAWWTFANHGALLRGDAALTGLLLVSGPLTALPLLFFAAAARRLPLATLGLVQYLSPTLQFLLAVWFFHEPFDSTRLIGFVGIWAALAVYSADALWQNSRRSAAAAAANPA